MASLAEDGDNRWRVQFVGAGGERRTIRIRGTEEQAKLFRKRVARLIVRKQHGDELDDDLIKWLSKLDAKTHSKLEKKGLVEPRKDVAAAITLSSFLDKFFVILAGKKPATVTSYGNVRRNLEDYFGKDKDIMHISKADADA